MTLLNPIWLWALGSLTIPIAIHMLSRKEGKTIHIGSIRFLAETSTSKFSSIRLNEVALLVLRCLLITLIVLLLASLIISTRSNKASQNWIAVEKGLETEKQVKTLLDSLQKNDYEIHRLSSGLPLFEDDTISQAPDYYKLAEELSQKTNVNAIVIGRNSIAGFKGKRISLPDNTIWLPYSVSPAQDLSIDSLTAVDTMRITIAYEKEFTYDQKIVSAALHALEPIAPAKIVIEETEIDNLKKIDSNWVIWLSKDAFPFEAKSLCYRGDAISNLIVQEDRDRWILTKRLHEENAVEQHLAIQLMNMLFQEQIRQEIRAHDKRSLSNELVWANSIRSQSIEGIETGKPADRILIFLIVLLFIAERTLAFYRKQ